MYNHEQLIDLVDCYLIDCEGQPTRQGLADYLEISRQTVNNVINGTYNGFIYTLKPHISRKIANNDFYIIRRLFVPNKGDKRK